MAKIIVLERNALLRGGIVQLISHVVTDAAVEGHGYAVLDEPHDESRQGALVLLSVPTPERRNSLIEASMRAFAPKSIILMSEGEPGPDAMHGLSPIVAGFVDKTALPEVFVASIRLILAGGTCFPRRSNTDPPPLIAPVAFPKAKRPLAADYTDVPPDHARAESTMLGLTPRQYDVLVLLARGDALKTIARRLNISVATAKAHTEGLYQRLDVYSRNAAVYVARARGAGLGWEPRQASLELRVDEPR